MPSNNHRGSRAVLVIPAFCLALAACGSPPAASLDSAPAAPAPSPVAVSLASVTRGSIGRSITLPATLRAHGQATLYAKTAGYLKTIRFDRGDFVKEGEVVAEIESPELLADLTRQRAELRAAEIAYKRVSDAQSKAPDLVMPQAVDDAKAKRDVAAAILERTETLLGYTTVKAPMAGIVTKRFVDPGAFIAAATSGSVASNAALVTIMDIRSVRVDIPVPEPEVPRVRVGLALEISLDELPGRSFKGAIGRFAYALDEVSKTMMAEAEIANPQRELRPGMYAKAKIVIDRHDDALLLPEAAVVTDKTGDSAFLVVDGGSKRVAVKTGFRDGAFVEILDGLALDQAVISAASRVSDGQRVSVNKGPK